MTTEDALEPLQRATQRALEGDIAGAIAGLEALVQATPEDDAAWLHLGLVLSSESRWDDASHALERAVALAGDVPRRASPSRDRSKSGKIDEAVSGSVEPTSFAQTMCAPSKT